MKLYFPASILGSAAALVSAYYFLNDYWTFLAPIILCIPAMVYMKTEAKENPFSKPNLFLNEAPAVVSLMSSVMASGGSFDSAVRFVAEKGPENSRKLFMSMVLDVDSRRKSDIREVFCETVSSFPVTLSVYRRALFMVVSASDASNESERSRILKEATDVALEGLKHSGEEYGSKLQAPCMVVFGLGIMVPMILLSVVPMLKIGDSVGISFGIPDEVLELIILIIVPAALCGVMFTIKGKNPMVEVSGDFKGIYKGIGLVSAVPIFILVSGYINDRKLAIVVSVVIASLITAIIVYQDVRDERNRQKVESGLRDMLYDLGNRLIAGENFETALCDSLALRKDCQKVAEAVSREFVMCRGDTEAAIRLCIDPYSVKMSEFICNICRASSKDSRDAGRLAVALAHQLQDQDSVRKDMNNKLRSMTDMMTGTSAIFAPLILGLSITMMGPIASITGDVNVDGTFMLIAVYLVELSILMSCFSSLLSGRFRATETVYRIATVLPISMIVLFACTLFSF